MMPRSNFEIEEEFDPVSLGLVGPAVEPPPAATRPTRRLQPRRSASGRYESADWSPSESTDATAVTEDPVPKFATPKFSAKDLLDALLASTTPSYLATTTTQNPPQATIDVELVKDTEQDDPAAPATPAPKSPLPVPPRLLPSSTETRGISESYDSGMQTELVSDTDMPIHPTKIEKTNPKRPSFAIRRVRVKLRGRKGYRLGLRVRRPSSALQTGSGSPAVKQRDFELEDAQPPPEPVQYDSKYQEQLATQFGQSALEALQQNARADANAGYKLPVQTRELFTAMGDLKVAVKMANELRTEIGAPLLSTQTDKVALRQSVAVTQTKLYTDIAAALVLPSAPAPSRKLWDGDKADGKPKVQMTPSSLEVLARELPAHFPQERWTLQAFWASGKRAAYGEEKNSVLWERGIGRMSGKSGIGFREHAVYQDSPVHIFVDHSNILYGLLTYLQTQPPQSLPPRHLRTLSLPCMSLLLRRGRETPPGSLHLVASSPLKQDLDPLVRLGWEVSVMKRVEIYEDEVLDPGAMTLVAKPQQRVHGAGGAAGEPHIGLKRFREQGVDEILHLKILQALNTKPTPAPKGSTIVLATGDARGGQFNRDGFLGAVREALKRGWTVELWSWQSGLSRAWVEAAKREKWGSNFGIHKLEPWAKQLVEEAEEEVD